VLATHAGNEGCPRRAERGVRRGMEGATRRRRPAAVVYSRGRRAEGFRRASGGVTRQIATFAVVFAAAAGLTLALLAAARPASANASTNPVAGPTSPLGSSQTATPAPAPTPSATPTPMSTPSPTPSPSTSPAVARSFTGTSAVGALFMVRKGGRLQHFCTAAVVRSPQEDLVITAAHCIWGKALGPKGDVIFGPGWHDGKFPKGRWVVMSALVDSNWKKDKNPNDDVAFLVVRYGQQKIQKFTGGEALETRTRLPQKVQVIGYPNTTSEPVKCSGFARLLLHHPNLHQLVFNCGGFTGGTSGGPFLMRVDKSTGAGQIIGVIGGYQEGGVSPSVSYSSQFLTNVADLYKRATS
jgi:V8-like Glu-specific endopeptidase